MAELTTVSKAVKRSNSCSFCACKTKTRSANWVVQSCGSNSPKVTWAAELRETWKICRKTSPLKTNYQIFDTEKKHGSIPSKLASVSVLLSNTIHIRHLPVRHEYEYSFAYFLHTTININNFVTKSQGFYFELITELEDFWLANSFLIISSAATTKAAAATTIRINSNFMFLRYVWICD